MNTYNNASDNWFRSIAIAVLLLVVVAIGYLIGAATTRDGYSDIRFQEQYQRGYDAGVRDGFDLGKERRR